MTRKTPPHIRLLEGNPGHRPVKMAGVVPKGDAVMPPYVTGRATEVWLQVVASMPPGTFKATDGEILGAYCLAAARQQVAAGHLLIEGEVLHGALGKAYRNPWGVIAREASAEIAKLGARLGLDPIARENIHVPPSRPAGKFIGLIPDDDR